MAVQVTPKSSATRILGTRPEADGRTALKVAIAAPPEDGKANDALIDFLAKGLSLPRRDLEIVQGATTRRKLLRISGEPEMLHLRIHSFTNKE